MSEQASRKVMVSPELMAAWTSFRDDAGRPVRMHWGEPDADGWFSPWAERLPCDHAFVAHGECESCGAVTK